jgi:two-component system KDP operon response regulator KdpE
MTKPFGIQELMARLRALLRNRSGGAELSPRYADERLQIDLGLREVTLDGVPLALTRKEYAVLAMLVRHAGRVVSQQQLLRDVWGGTHVHDTHYLRIVLGKLRQKLGDDPASPRWLKTEPGVGYRFLGGNG